MNEDARRQALAALGTALAEVVNLAFEELDPDKAKALGQQLASGEADLLVSVKMREMIVVGTLTSPEGKFAPQNVFRIEANPPEVGH